MQTFKNEIEKFIKKYEVAGKSFEIELYKIKCKICLNYFDTSNKNELYCNLCTKKRERYFLLEKSKIPLGYQNFSFKNFTINENNKLAFDMAKEFFVSPRGLYIYGGVGIGKTHLLISAFKRCLWDSNGEYLDSLKLFSKISKNWDTFKKERELEIFYDSNYLFLDDLGSEKISEHNIETTIMLLNERIQRGKKKVFITSNCDIQKLGENTDDRIASRIFELCGKPIEIKGSDFRLKL